MPYLFAIAVWLLAAIGAWTIAGPIGLIVVIAFFITIGVLVGEHEKRRRERQRHGPYAFLIALAEESEKWADQREKELAAKGITRAESPEEKQE